MIDYEVLVTVGLASFVLAKLFDALKDRFRVRWEAMPDLGREVAGYVIMATCAVLTWFTALNMFPGFSVVLPDLGRVLTCIAAGCGPSIVFDIWLDRPNPPQP